MKPSEAKAFEGPIRPTTMFKNCPIRTSLGVLGKKWTLLILRDIALLKVNRFNKILRTLPGLTPRVLIIRLHELEEAGLIRPIVIQEKPRLVKWVMTKQGKDTIPILMSFISYGSRWYSDVVFSDAQPRTVSELFPELPKLTLS